MQFNEWEEKILDQLKNNHCRKWTRTKLCSGPRMRSRQRSGEIKLRFLLILFINTRGRQRLQCCVWVQVLDTSNCNWQMLAAKQTSITVHLRILLSAPAKFGQKVDEGQFSSLRLNNTTIRYSSLTAEGIAIRRHQHLQCIKKNITPGFTVQEEDLP